MTTHGTTNDGETMDDPTPTEPLDATGPGTDADAPTPSAYNRFLVVKLSGKTLDTATVDALAADLKALLDAGQLPVVVHGGGAQLTAALERAGVASEFKDGLRVTTPEVLDVALRVFAAEGKKLAGGLSARGVPALALNGYDAGLLEATPKDGGALGLVGDVTSVGADLLRFLAYNGAVPVVGPPAAGPGPDGPGLNVNADDVAAAVAAWLPAAHLVFLTDVPGVLDTDGAVIPLLTPDEAAAVDGVSGGMTAKLQAAARAARSGVPRVLVAGAGASLVDLVAGKGTATVIAATAKDAAEAADGTAPPRTPAPTAETTG